MESWKFSSACGDYGRVTSNPELITGAASELCLVGRLTGKVPGTQINLGGYRIYQEVTKLLSGNAMQTKQIR